MLVFNKANESLQERLNYTKVPPKEAWDRLVEWVQKNKGFRVHLGFSNSDYTEMDGIYRKVKIEGQRLVFSDPSQLHNYFHISSKDIVEAECCMDDDSPYNSFNFRLQTKQTVQIMPYN